MSQENTLNATKLGDTLGLSARQTNRLLSELGWVDRNKNGWVATSLGKALGATEHIHSTGKNPYVLWPATLLDNPSLLSARDAITGKPREAQSETPAETEVGFRQKFKADYRTTDGHFVRSKAEALIDNWLYMAGIVHAYERKLPVEETLYSDFYLPAGRVYIEYWGYETDSRYQARMAEKRIVYEKYNLNLIELTDQDVLNLDDRLPTLLMRFGVRVE